ncbi:HDOD domain-containing protein [Thiovibrio frasassiensis]|uniref:HDOD domain-containing protein n=1 Tax=Thiovibrio frasassiensis TaxID=2984131 RepID=A0A9X4RKN7_9BACT|nr:HDOD domain-containing protein [Thiovibrio frasassiensis]MDG4474725.1 HDOD domain-containing protein [Thiovibrio frasassiensis]
MTSIDFNAQRLDHAKQIVNKIKLPAQPTIVIEINKEMRTEHPDFPRIAHLVTQDASISAKVINVINSPFFGLASKCESIVKALTYMGLENFRKVVLTACLQDALGGGTAADKIFWDHSLHTAVTAESLAKSMRGVLSAENITPDMAYMTGLFHDCAIPMLLKRTPEYKAFTHAALSHKRDIIQEEDALVGSDHCVVGGLLAKTWSLPEAVCKTIIHHHTSDLSGQGKVPGKLIALIKVADYIAYTFGYSIGMADRVIDGEWDPEEWSELNEGVLQELHMGPDDLIDLKDAIFEQLGAQ